MPKERYFLSGDRLKVVSFHVLLLDTAGNNLVNADFSLYLGHIFAVKHIYLTLYIVHICCVAPIYSVPACSRACSLRSLWPCARGRARACGRVAVLAPVRSRARVRAC